MMLPFWFSLLVAAASVAGFLLTVYGYWRFVKSQKFLAVDAISGVSTDLAAAPFLSIIDELKAVRFDQRTLSDQSKLISRALEQLPVKTLNTIQGSVNSTSGKLGELLMFLKLQGTYDRFFPVGDIIDFIGVKFPTETDPGQIDFIEIKTGDKAVLNSDQKKIRDMITKNKDIISFKVVKVEIN